MDTDKKLILASIWALEDIGIQEIQEQINAIAPNLQVHYEVSDHTIVIEGRYDQGLEDKLALLMGDFIARHEQGDLLDAPRIRQITSIDIEDTITTPVQSTSVGGTDVPALLDLEDTPVRPALETAETVEAAKAAENLIIKFWTPLNGTTSYFANDQHGLIPRVAAATGTDISADKSDHQPFLLRIVGQDCDGISEARKRLSTLEKAMNLVQKPHQALSVMITDKFVPRFRFINSTNPQGVALRRALVPRRTELVDPAVPIVFKLNPKTRRTRDLRVFCFPPSVEARSDLKQNWAGFTFPEVGNGERYAAFVNANQLAALGPLSGSVPAEADKAPPPTPQHDAQSGQVQASAEAKPQVQSVSSVLGNFLGAPVPPKGPRDIKTRKVVVSNDAHAAGPASSKYPSASADTLIELIEAECRELSAGKRPPTITHHLKTTHLTAPRVFSSSKAPNTTTAAPGPKPLPPGIKNVTRRAMTYVPSSTGASGSPQPTTGPFEAKQLGRQSQASNGARAPTIQPSSPNKGNEGFEWVMHPAPKTFGEDWWHSGGPAPTEGPRPVRRAPEPDKKAPEKEVSIQPWTTSALPSELTQKEPERQLLIDFTDDVQSIPVDSTAVDLLEQARRGNANALVDLQSSDTLNSPPQSVTGRPSFNQRPLTPQNALPGNSSADTNTATGSWLSGGFRRLFDGQSDGPSSVLSPAIEAQSSLMSVFQAVRAYPGRLSLDIQFGLALVLDVPSSEIDKAMTLEGVKEILNPPSDSERASTTTKFTKRLTASPTDVDYIVNMMTSGRRLFEPVPLLWTVHYEVHCQTQAGNIIITKIDDDGSSAITAPPTTLSTTHLIYPTHIWDAAIVLQGHGDVGELDPETKSAAQDIATSLWVELHKTRLRLFTRTTDKLAIQSVFMKRSTFHRHISGGNEELCDRDIRLKVTEIQDLMLSVHRGGEIVVEARCAPLAEMVTESRQWWEVSLVGPVLDTVLKSNESLEPGEITKEWISTDLLDQDAGLGPAGRPVAAAIGPASLGGLLRLAETVVQELDPVGHGNVGLGLVNRGGRAEVNTSTPVTTTTPGQLSVEQRPGAVASLSARQSMGLVAPSRAVQRPVQKPGVNRLGPPQFW